MAGAGGRSGAERHEATCHPRLGGACEANGLVRVAQAGVAGAALARDGRRSRCHYSPHFDRDYYQKCPILYVVSPILEGTEKPF